MCSQIPEKSNQYIFIKEANLMKLPWILLKNRGSFLQMHWRGKCSGQFYDEDDSQAAHQPYLAPLPPLPSLPLLPVRVFVWQNLPLPHLLKISKNIIIHHEDDDDDDTRISKQLMFFLVNPIVF